jgi:hypothetical protein
MKYYLFLLIGLLCCSGVISQSEIQYDYSEMRQTQSDIRQQLSGQPEYLHSFFELRGQINHLSSQSGQFKMDSVIYEDEGVDDPTILQPYDKEEYRYNDDGQLIEEIFYEYSRSEEHWTPIERNTFQYDAEGKLTEWIIYDFSENNQSWERSTRYTYQYNSNGDLIEQIISEWRNASQQWRNELRFNISYIAAGQVETTTIYSWSISQGDWVPTFFEEYEYNDEDLLTAQFGFSWSVSQQEWADDSRLLITYDDDGNPIVQSNEIYIESDELWREMLRTENQYDDKGNVIEEVTFRVNTQDVFEKYYLQEFTYDDEDRIIEQVSSLYDSFSDEWVPNFLNSFEYDDPGNPLRETIHFQFEEGQWTPVFANIYEYNPDVLMRDVWNPGTFFLTDLPLDLVVNKLLVSSTEELFFQAGLLLDRETYYYSEVMPSSTSDLEKMGISVYPVPASDAVYFGWEGMSEKMEVVIFDMSGKAIQSGSISRYEALSVEKLSPGMYIYQLSDGQNSIRGKLSIQ